jgi:hypothetical protein
VPSTSENKFQHLAIIPEPRTQLWSRRSCPLDWVEVPCEDGDGRTKYFHTYTGNLLSNRPGALKELDRALAEDQGQPPPAGKKKALDPEEAVRRQQLRELAMANMREWDMFVDFRTGFMSFVNNLTGATSQTLPPDLDTFGNLSRMVVLKMNNNLLKALPDSMGKMADLEVLEARNNYIKKVPNAMKKWTKLRVMMLEQNDIPNLPNLFDRLTTLQELCLTNNVLQELPDSLGRCSKLRKLMLGKNQLTKLPYTFGFLTSLQELQVFNNPIEDPPMDALVASRDELLWLLRKKYKESVMGPPPEVRIRRSGIAGELLSLEPELTRDINKQFDVGPGGKPPEAVKLNMKGEAERGLRSTRLVHQGSHTVYA